MFRWHDSIPDVLTLEIHTALYKGVSQITIFKVTYSFVFQGTEGRRSSGGLSLSHAVYRVSRGHVGHLVGSDQHSGNQEVLKSLGTKRPVRNAIGAAVLYLEAGSGALEQLVWREHGVAVDAIRRG